LLAACASVPTPDAKLSQAQLLLERIQAGAGCSERAVAGAEEALEYARFEETSEASDALASQRADVALEKALEAQAACRRISSQK